MWVVVLLVTTNSCTARAQRSLPSGDTSDPLPSWREGVAKERILNFVQRVTSLGKDYVPPEERLATFDNDGTLWCEKPVVPQLVFIASRVDALVQHHLAWKKQLPFRTILEQGVGALVQLDRADVYHVVTSVESGMTQSEYRQEVRHFLASARQPRWERLFTQLVYQPLCELINYLVKKDFQVFIVTGGGREFVRTISQQLYHIPRERVVGSCLQTRFEIQGEEPRVVRLPQFVEPINIGEGKPVMIDRDIGRRPLLSCGNSDGDVEMLQFTESRDRPWLAMLIKHDDSQREYAYEQGAAKVQRLATTRGWTVVSMRNDFSRVFPFQRALP